MSQWTARNHPKRGWQEPGVRAVELTPSYSRVILYDAEGNVIGEMDAVTRKRTLYPSPVSAQAPRAKGGA